MRRVKLLRAYKMDSVTGDKDQVVYVMDYVAADLIHSGNAVAVDGGDPQPAPVVQELPGTLTKVSEPTSQSDDSPERRAEDGVDEPPGRPKPYSPKHEWIDYAVNGEHGQTKITPERAEGMTKADLISRYGERL